MSKDLVKVDKSKALSFNDLEEASPEFVSSFSLSLDPALPMPVDAGEKWELARNQWQADVESNKNGVQERIAARMGMKTRFVSLANKLKNDNLPPLAALIGLVFGTATAALSEPFVMLLIGIANPEFSEFFAGIGDSPALIMLSVFWGGLPCLGFSVASVSILQENRAKIINASSTAFSHGYSQYVSQWVQERYGLQIGEAWASKPVGAIAEDIIYLGVKDGQKVYCFETAEGWILGHRDGTELPVLSSNLIEA